MPRDGNTSLGKSTKRGDCMAKESIGMTGALST